MGLMKISKPSEVDVNDPMLTLRMIRSLGLTPAIVGMTHTYTGKLGLKQEAAGKMRVFAMVDPWTQWVMRPFHKGIFSILNRIPMDGTFDQLRPLKRVRPNQPYFSMDLSSATDRLPIDLQTDLFRVIFNLTPKEASAWKSLLVDRPYKLPKDSGSPLKSVTYSVGQPMGALSSWAMLAITHHFIVQIAAWESGTTKS